MFWPIFARGPWPETFKASYSPTNQTANKQGRQKKCVKIFLNFTKLHKTQPGQKTGEYPNIWRIDSFKKTQEISNSFLSWLRFMKVGKVEKNFHTFLLSSSLIRRLIGPKNEALKVSGHGPRAKIG